MLNDVSHFFNGSPVLSPRRSTTIKVRANHIFRASDNVAGRSAADSADPRAQRLGRPCLQAANLSALRADAMQPEKSATQRAAAGLQEFWKRILAFGDQYWSDFDDMVVFGKRAARSI